MFIYDESIYSLLQLVAAGEPVDSVVDGLLAYTTDWLVHHIERHDIPELSALAAGRALDFDGHLVLPAGSIIARV